jgi:type I restriction enzyme S subunit
MLKFRWETEFKESEIGEIPKDWDEKKLKDIIVDISKGKTPQKRHGDLPYLSAKFLRGEEEPELYYDKEAGTFVDENDIIILWDGSNSGEIFKGKKGLLASTMCELILKEQVSKKFIYYVLKSKEDELKDAKSGTDDRHVDKDYFLTISIPYPHPLEQERIASVLSWFDDLIENKKRQNEVLEKTAMAIFKSWFMDFEPFKHEEFVDSPLGEIPGGWNVKPIGELAEIRNGLSYSGKEKFEEPVDGSYVFITLNNAIEGGGFKPVYAWIKSNRIKEHHFLREGDLIIPNTEQTKDERLLGSPGIVFFPPNYKNAKGVYSHHITKISPYDTKYTLFLYLFLRFTREDSASFATGTGVLGMDIDNFKKNKLVVIPSKPILEEFHALVEPLFRKIILNQKQIMVLRKIRDALLPLLVFGRLRVEEV